MAVRTIDVRERVMAKNDQLAADVRSSLGGLEESDTPVFRDRNTALAGVQVARLLRVFINQAAIEITVDAHGGSLAATTIRVEPHTE